MAPSLLVRAALTRWGGRKEAQTAALQQAVGALQKGGRGRGRGRTGRPSRARSVPRFTRANPNLALLVCPQDPVAPAKLRKPAPRSARREPRRVVGICIDIQDWSVFGQCAQRFSETARRGGGLGKMRTTVHWGTPCHGVSGLKAADRRRCGRRMPREDATERRRSSTGENPHLGRLLRHAG
jgi:hypothetical protein